MTNKYDSKLGRALKLNYWTVSEAALYICAVNGAQIADITRIPPIPSLETNSKLTPEQEGYYAVVRYWYDSDHTIQPREGSGLPDSPTAQYPVHYFIRWAVSKEFKIHWLDSAIQRGLLPKDIADRPLKEIQPAPNTAPQKTEINHKKERTYLLIIAALLHEQGIDWTSRTANSDIRKHIDSIGKKLKVDAMSSVLKDLSSDDEIMNFLVEGLRNKA